MNPARIVLIDDEPNTLKVLSAILRKKGYEVVVFSSAEEALQDNNTQGADTVIVDYKLPGMSGIDFVERFKMIKPSPPVIMLTAFGTIERAVEAMRKGAFNYLTKPVNPSELITVVREALEKHSLLIENIALKSQLRQINSFQNIIGKCHRMQELFSLISTVAKSSSNVLVTGESGTGKELAAKAIHHESPRADKPFIPLDCAALPEEIIESELFGHEKGSFTGAYDRKTGQIEIANEGTLFLDEISELPLNLQKKFLRFLQEKEIMRVGGTKRVKVDVRIIAATNRDLTEEVSRGNFREDLFYRLNVVTLRLPPLRERKEDIPLLADHFLKRFNKINCKSISAFDREAFEAFMEYDWRGNVRELENAVERAVVLCPADTISIRYLPKPLRDVTISIGKSKEPHTLIETEHRLILEALNKTGFNQTKAAEILGITRKQLRTKMKNHGLLNSKEDD